MMRKSMIGFTAVLLAFTCAAITYTALAQDYPTRVIRVVVGPGPDVVARVYAPKLAESLGQQIVIEPRAGAGGAIAAQTITTASPDGYNLLLATASYTINAALGSWPYDLRKDFVAVGQMSTSPFVLVVHPSVPVKSVQELIALAKSKPGQLNYASSGIGTPPHLGGELFKAMAGVNIVHVPYREANSALNAVIAGNVQMMFSIATTAQAQIAGGTVRGLGVATLSPTSLVPGVPTIASQGLDGFEVIGWNGVVAPPGTPAVIVSKLNAAIQHGIADPQLKSQLQAAGYDVAAPNTPEQFAKFINDDTERWAGVVKKANISVK
jgi:tripartite-type tricarboxylate transporter receptor subunit TctC